MSNNAQWRPAASLDVLQKRADVFRHIRHFFQARDVLEVETPLLASYSVTDPAIECFRVPDVEARRSIASHDGALHLQSSPEYAMKRLLAAYRQPIFQICKAFRNEGHGRYHNPEFSMLEWYRPDYSYQDLMTEVAELMVMVLGVSSSADQFVERRSYQNVFFESLNINPHRASVAQLREIALTHIEIDAHELDKPFWLDLLFSHLIETKLGQEKPCLIYDYPAEQSALACVAANSEGDPVAQRFELYYQGVELANGYQELVDAAEQQRRFSQDIAIRQQRSQLLPTADKNLLAALESGLPACAGVALGLDRLLMVICGIDSIDQVLAFPIEKA